MAEGAPPPAAPLAAILDAPQLPAPAAEAAQADQNGAPSVTLLGGSLVSRLPDGSGGAPLLWALDDGATVQPICGGAVVGLSLPEQAPTSLLDVAIGRLPPVRWLALARCKLYWMVPAWGRGAAGLPPETQLLLLELEGGAYGLLAPLIDGGAFRASLRPPRRRPADPPTALVLRVESGAEEVRANAWKGLLYASSGRDPFALLDRGVAAAAALSGAGRPRWEKPAPESLDCFGWCTWDAMYTDVCPAGIRRGLDSLAACGTPARLLLIDDGWQQTDLDAEYQLEGAAASPLQSRSAERLTQERRFSELLASGDLQAIEPLKVMEARRAADSVLKQGPHGGGDGVGADGTAGGAAAATAGGAAPAGATTNGDQRSGNKPEQGANGWLLLSGLRALAATLARAARRAAAGTESAVVGWLKSCLEDAASDSARLKAFCALAVGPLKHAVLRFYARSSWHSRRLLSLGANAKFSSPGAGPEAGAGEAAPRGALGAVVRELKAAHGLRFVFCWHALCGYWSGVMPGAPGVEHLEPRVMYPRFSPGTLEVDPSMQWAHPAVAGVGVPAEPQRLHRELHAYLAESGVDGVKVDVQSTMTAFGYASGGYAATGAHWHASLEGSVAAALPGCHQINSMCCAIEDLYNMSHSNIARVGEDFYPALPASHTAHIANAAFCTLMVGALAFPDWDMFHSDHGSAKLHAAARAISGGMVYTSDRAGEHDPALIRRLVLPDGSVLRCRLPGRPTADCLFADVSRDGRSALKVWNMNAVTGAVAAFNVQGSAWSVRRRCYHTHDRSPPALAAGVRPADVPLLPQARLYAVYSDALGEVRLLRRDDAFSLALAGAGGHDFLTLSPLLERGGCAVAPLGLANMLNAGGAVLAASLEEAAAEEAAAAEAGAAAAARGARGGGCVCRIAARGCGAFLLAASARPWAVEVDGRWLGEGEVAWDGGAGLCTFPLSRDCATLARREVAVWF